MPLETVASVIAAVKNTSSYTAKQAILAQNSNNAELKEVLRFIYNPYMKTGISDAKLTKALLSASTESVTWQEALQYFSTHQTGSDTDLAVARNFVLTYTGYARELAKAILTQSLQIGVSVTTLNTVYGKDFIPKVGCMLGTPYADVGQDRVAWPCIVTEKLDGVRRILIKEHGVCRLFSRSGHEDTGLVDIMADAAHLPDNFVYDGELLAKGEFKDNIAQRQATNSLANCKGLKRGLTLNVFDMLPVNEFYAGKSKDGALNRKILLGATFMDDSISYIDEEWAKRIAALGMYADLSYIVPVPILGLVSNIDEVTPIVEKVWARGGEGVMLNTTTGRYEIKRVKTLLKVKHSEEHVLTVIDLVEGTNKYEDSLGALVVGYKNSYVGVGSGFTDAQRQEIWDNPNKYIGRKVEIETFGESINAQGCVSLNCPIFLRFVGDEHE